MIIKLYKLSKRWNGFQIRNVSLEIDAGEYFVILGPTGAGKTLLLELIAGFHSPDSGSIFLNGREVTNAPPECRSLGFVYQDYMLFPHKSVRKNIAYGLEARHIPKPEIEKKVNEIAVRLGLGSILNHSVANLSGGEQQRVALARALVLRPKILLLDEPLSALDPQTHKELMLELKNIHSEFGLTTLHVTHNREEAFILADRIGILHKGRLIQLGSPEQIFRKPKSEFVARFVGVENVFHGTATPDKDGTSVIELDDGLKLHAISGKRGMVMVTIRPEDIIVLTEKVRTSARNLYSGRVCEILDRMTVIQLGVEVGTKLFRVYITHQSFSELNINLGSQLWIMFKASAVNVF